MRYCKKKNRKGRIVNFQKCGKRRLQKKAKKKTARKVKKEKHKIAKKRWKKKKRSNSELWAATPKTVNILYLEQHERKYNTEKLVQ